VILPSPAEIGVASAAQPFGSLAKVIFCVEVIANGPRCQTSLEMHQAYPLWELSLVQVYCAPLRGVAPI
jgi:hypothetical protein